MKRRIIAFPYKGNIYTELLYSEVQRRGVAVIEGEWTSRWILRHLRPNDMIHIHWPSFLYFVPGSRLRTGLRLARLAWLMSFAKLRGATIVWTAHNLYPHEGGGTLLSDRLGRKIVVAFADTVCAHGASAAAILAKEFGVDAARLRIGQHAHWIGYYPDTTSRTASRAKLGIPAAEFLYLHIGRCRPYKGLEALIEAFKSAPQPASLLIAGSFSSPQYLDKIAAVTKSAPKVTLVPRSIPDDELQDYLTAADCVVLPYRAVLTSGTVMLALSFGRAVVTPDLGAMRDHVDANCGILYPADQPLALAHALAEMQSRTFDATAIKDHARGFTWSRLADMLLDAP